MQYAIFDQQSILKEKRIIMPDSLKKSQVRRNEILKASQELFHEKGFHKTAVIDIMKRVGCAKGAFYYYYDSKENVLDALVNINIMQLEDAFSKIANNGNLNALEKLKLILIKEINLSFDNYHPENHLHDIQNVDMHQKIMVGMNSRISPIIGMVVKQGVQDGIFKTNYPLEVTEILVAGIHLISDLGIFHWNKQQYLSRMKAAAELIEKSLSLDEGCFNFLADLLCSVPEIAELTSSGEK